MDPKQEYYQFLNPENLASQQKLMAGYYQQMIQMYGVSIQYFRRKYDFFDPDGLLNAAANANYTYGYDSNYEFGNVIDMRGYIELGNDAFIFSMVGIDSQQDGKIFFTKEQFSYDFLNAIGRMTTSNFTTDFTIDVENFEATYLHTENYDPFSLTFGDDIIFSGEEVNDAIDLTVSDASSNINNTIAGYKSYTYNWLIQGLLSGVVSGTLDAEGNGTLNVTAAGDLTYNRPATDAESNGWNIAPQSGDFIRITYGDETTEDFSLTSVTDRDLNQDGISPFLGKFVWKCEFTRRTSSHETVPSGYEESEQFENDYLNDVVVIQDDISDEIFDYDDVSVDKNDIDDDVYGGF